MGTSPVCRAAARLRPLVIAIAAAAFAFSAGAASGEKPVRVDFTSQPEGATLLLDGANRGVTPLTLFDIAPGGHHARLELKGYEPHDDFFTLQDGGYLVRSAELAPVKGLLLITTEPDGCSLSLDGLSLGVTPRLVTSLDANRHYRFTLQKPGYQSKTVEVRFAGRTPLVKHEKMMLDSGRLKVTSAPDGAKVVVNGIARGETPLSISDIPKGRSLVEISKDGYKTQTREISLGAGDFQTVHAVLEGKPGALFLTSVPDGARFYIDGEACGKGPISLSQFKPGRYSIRAELDGHGGVTREVVVGLGQTVNEEFRLESVLGRLEVKTVPSGAQIFVDGKALGTTRMGGASEAEASAVFAVEALQAGEHVLAVRKDGYAEAVLHPVVENLRTTSKTVRLRRIFKPNVRLVTATGTYTGVFIDNSNDAVTIEVSMGITRSFPREDIKKIDFIGNEDAQQR